MFAFKSMMLKLLRQYNNNRNNEKGFIAFYTAYAFAHVIHEFNTNTLDDESFYSRNITLQKYINAIIDKNGLEIPLKIKISKMIIRDKLFVDKAIAYLDTFKPEIDRLDQKVDRTHIAGCVGTIAYVYFDEYSKQMININ